ncbi:TraU family protein [Orientia tsutsugamushi]|uniref:Conjugal transfer protein n=1 Tax=Orientia tsutsugamushi TaxID=784 RepID=A0A2U3RMN9_ORITS|nr:traU family protein [Orientia tsutsugamushi str. Karp]SPR14514.1 conjugal transfer protein [Orientia tsutsugamushi]
MPYTNASGRLICLCLKQGIPIPVPGIPVGFWEPVRLVDVTKSPMCMVSLGGLSLEALLKKAGLIA